MLSKDQWEHLETLFQSACERPPAQRSAWLDTHCPDPVLRAEVQRLLDGADRPELTSMIAAEARTLAGISVKSGDRVGAWRILRPIAEGGMAAVFLAEPAEGADHQQQVAIKVLPGALRGGELSERFEHERRILAGLKHPNIVALLDGGQTDAGLPYLVMEFVRGETLERYCQLQVLALAERLRLVCKLCAALQLAHERQIVHRDIKPANVLVDDNGEPRLLDFGIAKLLDDEPRGSEPPRTRAGQRLMTPEYASPEQVRGEAIGTASDIYSMGVVLYQLLTGQSPYARWLGQPLELQKAICETDPPPPSVAVGEAAQRGARDATPGPTVSRTAPPMDARALRGDLDQIVLKAMHKTPQRRYASAAALAADLQCVLDNRPIAARLAQPARILVADDEPANIRLLGEMLSAERYEVRVARSGEDALAQIAADPPDLMLLDVVMPGLDGYQVCERLRAQAATAGLPVILVTGARPEEERVKGLDAGADEFLTKPVNREELLARVRALLRVQNLLRQIADWNDKLESRVAEQVDQIERLGSLRNYLPQRVAEAIVNEGSDALLEPRRRQVTVCVIDLRGFTPFAESVEPEEVVAVLREFYTEMGRIVETYQGTVEHFAGDSMTIFFNAPFEMPAPEESAVRCALAMRERFVGLRERWARLGHQLGLGIGLSRGYATIGAIGFAGRWQYAAIGAVTNLAARLCASAEHGEIRAPMKLVAVVDGIVESEALGEQQIKGFQRPVSVMRLLRARPGDEA